MQMKIEVKVFPKASRSEIVEKDGKIKVYITAAPDKGKANKAVIDLMSERYKVKKSNVKIVLGETSRNKIIEIKNVGEDPCVLPLK